MNALPRFRKTITEDALRRGDFPALRAHLEGIPESNGTLLRELLACLRRARGIVLTRRDVTQIDRRTAFLAHLRAYAASRWPGREHEVDDLATLIDRIETIYFALRDDLSRSTMRTVSAVDRVSIYIARLSAFYETFRSDYERQLKADRSLHMAGRLQFVDAEGQSGSPDALLSGMTQSYTDLLRIEGDDGGWFDAEGCFVLPDFVMPAVERIEEAAAEEHLARVWKQWRRTEERIRFVGGQLVPASLFVTDRLLESEHLDGFVYHPPEDGSELFDEVANDRLIERFTQSFLDLQRLTGAKDQVPSLDSAVPLFPGAYISVSELQSANALRGMLSYDFTQDEKEYGGLRLVEWLRGYSALSRWANETFSERKPGLARVPIIALHELESWLQRWGLSAAAAALFIDHASFRRGARDLFDTPLIRLGGDRVIPLYPCLLDTNPALIVLSALSRLEVNLGHKGESFEVAVAKLLQANGIEIRHKHEIRRDRETYEYDVLARWGAFIFVIECKSRGLSMGSPIQAYTLDLKRRESAVQLNRLVGYLKASPNVLTDLFGPEAEAATLVPVVLNALPFALPGEQQGVYYSDWSALQRFFEERYLFFKIPYEIAPGKQILHRLSLADLWGGDRPTPEGLMAVLEGSPQLKMALSHIRTTDQGFTVSDRLAFVTTEYGQIGMTLDTVTEAFGLDVNRIKAEIRRVKQSIGKTRKAWKKRQPQPANSKRGVRAADRRWRLRHRSPTGHGEPPVD